MLILDAVILLVLLALAGLFLLVAWAIGRSGRR